MTYISMCRASAMPYIIKRAIKLDSRACTTKVAVILQIHVACIARHRRRARVSDSSKKKSLNSRIFGSSLMPVISNEIIIISSIYTIVTNK